MTELTSIASEILQVSPETISAALREKALVALTQTLIEPRKLQDYIESISAGDVSSHSAGAHENGIKLVNRIVEGGVESLNNQEILYILTNRALLKKASDEIDQRIGRESTAQSWRDAYQRDVERIMDEEGSGGYFRRAVRRIRQPWERSS